MDFVAASDDIDTRRSRKFENLASWVKLGTSLDPAPIPIVSDIASFADGHDGTPILFCPCLKGLDKSHAAALALLPIHDANGELLDHPESRRQNARPLYACMFAGDPFRSVTHLMRKLAELKVEGVANFPTVGILDDDMLAELDRVGLGLDREVDLIRRAADLGMRTAAVVTNTQWAQEFALAGAQLLLVAPWLSTRHRQEVLRVAEKFDLAALPCDLA